MTENLENAYALLVGVDDSQIPSFRLKPVANDVSRLAEVLVSAERAAYLPEHVLQVTGKEATKEGIEEGVEWLRGKLKGDKSGEATAFIYYSGHGSLDDQGNHRLIPYDVDANDPVESTIAAADFAGWIAGMSPKRLFVAMDCCHAFAVGAKGDPDPPVPSSLAPAAVTPDSPAFSSLVSLGGRAVLSSSTADEKSWLRKDGSMSVFTYHLIEALTGHAKGSDTSVKVTDVMSHLAENVPKTVAAERPGHTQTPMNAFTGAAFPIALVMGGKGAKGMPLPDPAVRPPLRVAGVVEVGTSEGGSVTGVAIEKDLPDGAEVAGRVKVDKAKNTDVTGVRFSDGG